MTQCCVSNCSEIGTHTFPKDEKLRKLWLKAIRRPKFTPKTRARICRNHFTDNDYEKISKYTGVEHVHKFLRKSAVPSLFSWNNKLEVSAREQRLKARNCIKSLLQEALTNVNISENSIGIALNVEVKTSEDTGEKCGERLERNVTRSTQTPNMLRLFSTELLLSDDESVEFYTGLETVNKFNLVLSTLLPMAYDIKYRWSQVVSVPIEDQLLMLLIKLRRNKPDFELGKIFGISKTEVYNIIITWINFVHNLWSLIDIWPSKEVVNIYMLDCFRDQHPSTRLVIDGTEIPIKKPSHPELQRASYSHYKHRNTLKFLVGCSPGGLLTYCSGAYSGSTSDRDIVESSSLLEKCDAGDSAMADRGSQIPCVQLRQDQNLAKQQVHIGSLKTYKILGSKLNKNYIPLASKIFFVCMMLCNFKEVKNRFNSL